MIKRLMMGLLGIGMAVMGVVLVAPVASAHTTYSQNCNFYSRGPVLTGGSICLTVNYDESVGGAAGYDYRIYNIKLKAFDSDGTGCSDVFNATPANTLWIRILDSVHTPPFPDVPAGYQRWYGEQDLNQCTRLLDFPAQPSSVIDISTNEVWVGWKFDAQLDNWGDAENQILGVYLSHDDYHGDHCASQGSTCGVFGKVD